MDTKSSRTPRTVQKTPEKKPVGRTSALKSSSGKTAQTKDISTKDYTPRLKVQKELLPKDESKPEIEPPISFEVDGEQLDLHNIDAGGDIVLDVIFDNSQCSRSIQYLGTGVPPKYSPFGKTGPRNTRVLYRVGLETLKKASKYFGLLLGSSEFKEGRQIADTFAALKLEDTSSEKLDVLRFPRVRITDDGEATRIAGRDGIFADLLRILHGRQATSKLSMPYLVILAIMADRFDCAPIVGRYVRSRKVSWPTAYGPQTIAMEETMRQRVLFSWLLEDRLKFAAYTKDLVLRGSVRWRSEEDVDEKLHQALWWNLPDDLEDELQYRRSAILHTLFTLQTHFLGLYTSKDRQCKLFYDSSAACDSFQLGEMIKFFVGKGLLVYTSPLSATDDMPDAYAGDIEMLMKELRQCPAYQYDKNHAHCGLRTRLLPILDFVQAVLALGVGIDHVGWRANRVGTSWQDVQDPKEFRFTRSISGDPRLKVDGLMTSSPLAKNLFTACRWDWTPEA